MTYSKFAWGIALLALACAGAPTSKTLTVDTPDPIDRGSSIYATNLQEMMNQFSRIQLSYDPDAAQVPHPNEDFDPN